MRLKHPFRRAALPLLGLLAIGLLASAPAGAAQVKIYGSGAALQAQLQNNILIPNFTTSTNVQFDSTTSSKGFAVFGNNTSVLAPGEDSIAPQLDEYIATDSAATTEQLINAQTAAGSTSTNEITVPIAQTAIVLLVSLPSGITLNTTQKLKLTNVLAGEAYAGTAPAAGTYSVNTWGAFLTDAGLTATKGTPASGQFQDSGGGTKTISVEVRKNGAGTTYNLKEYLNEVELTDWSKIPVDSNAFGTKEWPAGATLTPATGNSTDAEEVSAVSKTAGTLGYGTGGDAASGGFTSTPTTGGASQQVLYALLQDNGTKTVSAQFADPENGTKANIYDGPNIKVDGGTKGAGKWFVPSKGSGEFNQNGSWDPTQASDPNILNDGDGSTLYYPLIAVAYDYSWTNFSVGNLATDYPEPANSQATTQEFLDYATSTKTQALINKSGNFYKDLPTGGAGLANIQADALAAAKDV